VQLTNATGLIKQQSTRWLQTSVNNSCWKHKLPLSTNDLYHICRISCGKIFVEVCAKSALFRFVKP